MKPNDIVVLENGLYGFCLVLEKSKHLFEIVKIDNDIARIKSLNTGVELAVGLENIRLATLKERYLREGYLLELTNGLVFLTTDKGAFNNNEYLDYRNYNDDMISKVCEVYRVYKIKSVGMVKYMLNTNHHTLVWQRKPKIELTDDEKVILRNLDNDRYYTISRKENGGLRLGFRMNRGVYISFNGYDNLFQSITHESGVHEIKELLK